VVSLDQRLRFHTYSEGAIRLFVQLVMKAACSLRGASAVMQLLGGLCPQLERAPVANTGQMWLLRIGLYELSRPKEIADDWVLILDHTVQIGTTKFLLGGGVRLSTWRAADRAVEHRDLEMFALEPVEKSDGPTVARQLEAVCERTGIVPRAILSDEGSDLKGGINAFCEKHPETAALLDIAHQAAKHLKRELEADDRWATFCSRMGRSKQRLAQTPLAHLLPPTPRAKARYMNVRELVVWGRKALRYLDDPRPVAGQPVDRAALRAKLGWLKDHREALDEWKELMSVARVALCFVRREGYHQGAADVLRQQLAPWMRSATSTRLGTALLEFVELQSTSARPGERLLGSSECLESLIGKGKRLEGQQSKSGFTKMILSMAAAVVRPTREYVTAAMACIKTRDVTDWCKEQLGTSLQTKRRLALASVGNEMG
jgi:hypothetical protein